ncbi:hypothetical protein BJ166DRAFT_631049 [Pestalotiopsis sp. NC0098]|nr:hypothetical protein BJ166DRAFT_631049 [Pestalotiopsis sp. NC0098]
MPPHQPRYLLAEDVTDRVFVHEGRVWCVLPPAGQEPEPVLEVFQEKPDEEDPWLDHGLMDVTGDEDSIHPEQEHDGINYDNQEAPDSPAAANATSSDVSPGAIIDHPIKFNKADVKNESTWLCPTIKEMPLAHVATGMAASVQTHLAVSHICARPMRSDKMGVKDVLDFEVPGRTDGLTFGNASVTGTYVSTITGAFRVSHQLQQQHRERATLSKEISMMRIMISIWKTEVMIGIEGHWKQYDDHG